MQIEKPTENELMLFRLIKAGCDFEGGGLSYQRYGEILRYLQKAGELNAD